MPQSITYLGHELNYPSVTLSFSLVHTMPEEQKKYTIHTKVSNLKCSI